MQVFPEIIKKKCDAIIALTLPDWEIDQVTHLYCDAVLFAAHCPVIFIKPDLLNVTYYYEATKFKQIEILHVYSNFDSTKQEDLIASALNEKEIISPLMLIYNPLFIGYAKRAYSPYKIYYASDNYSLPNFQKNLINYINSLIKLLDSVDDIVCTSADVYKSILTKNANSFDKLRIITNDTEEKSLHNNFEQLIAGIEANLSKYKTEGCSKNVLILYESKSLHVGAIKDHLQSFSLFSSNNIYYASATKDADNVPELHVFDAVIIHFSLRLSVNYGNCTLSKKTRKKLKKYSGLKVAFIQDEYDTTNTAIDWLKSLGIQLVFTCVPEHFIEQIYSKKQFPHTLFINNLTGYISDVLVNYLVLPIENRKIYVAYRGRNLPYWYGNLGQEKEYIGKKMKSICIQKGIPENIEWDEKSRIYGDAWLQFLATSKATLGTESGSNIFDFTGEIKANILEHLKNNPETSYKIIYEKFLSCHEGTIKMNQISPKIFEAISLKTALILFEGEYSGILIPNLHFIPLKKDFSNINDVLEKLNDDHYLQNLVNNVFQDIVESKKYSYATFIDFFDQTINSLLKNCQEATISDKYRHLLDKNELIRRSPKRKKIVYYCYMTIFANRYFRSFIDKIYKINIINPILKKIRIILS